MSEATAAARPDAVLALDVGGTHVSSALIDMREFEVIDGTRTDLALEPHGTAHEIVARLVECAATSLATGGPVDATLGVAMPGPFDYGTGIGRYADVGKFDALDGVDVRTMLLDGLEPHITEVRFTNDANAFIIGEWRAGAAVGNDHAAGITIGSGIGSAFLEHGRPIEDDDRVPPKGRAHLLTIDGQPLEDRVSRRAILRAAAGHPVLATTRGADVRDLADAARAGDPSAADIFSDAFTALGRALGPWLARFGAGVLVVGGGIAGSWDLVEPPLTVGLASAELPWRGPVVRTRLGRTAGLIGAAIASSNAEDSATDS